MGWLADETVKGVDEYVAGLREDAQESQSDTLLSLTAFDSHPGEPLNRHWHIAEPVETIPSIEGRYHPRGGTPLYDAIAHSLIETDKALEKMGQPDMKVLHVTITDGGENSSTDYPRDGSGSNVALAALVREYENLTPEERRTLDQDQKNSLVEERVASDNPQGTWTFVYLGAGHANMEAAQAAAVNMGFRAVNSSLYAATPQGTSSTFSSLRSATSTRKHSSDVTATAGFFAESGQTPDDYGVSPENTGGGSPGNTGGGTVAPAQPGEVADETGLKKATMKDLLGEGK